MSRTARLTTTLVAVALAAGLAGCSASPGAAAVVDGRTISQAEVEQTYDELAPLLQSAQPSVVVQALIVAPDILAAAEDNGVGVSEEDALALLGQVTETLGLPAGTEWGPGSVQIARSEVAGQNLSALDNGQEVLTALNETIAARTVEVNPQYGTFSAESLSMTPITWPWIAG